MTTDEIVIELATALNRERSLNDRESRWLEAAVRREERRNGRGREYWTRSEDSRLKRMLTRGKRPQEIATILGRTVNTVRRRMNKLGVYCTHSRCRPDLRGPKTNANDAEMLENAA